MRPSQALYYATLAAGVVLGILMSDRVSRVMALGACWILASFLLQRCERPWDQGTGYAGTRWGVFVSGLHPMLLGTTGLVAFAGRDQWATVLVSGGVGACTSILLEGAERRRALSRRPADGVPSRRWSRRTWQSIEFLVAMFLVGVGALSAALPDAPGAVSATTFAASVVLLLVAAIGYRVRRTRTAAMSSESGG